RRWKIAYFAWDTTFAPDLDQLLPQGREPPALDRLREYQLPKGVGQVVGARGVQPELPIDAAAGRAWGVGGRVVLLHPPVDGLGLLPQLLRRGHGAALPRLVPAGPSTSPSVTSSGPRAPGSALPASPTGASRRRAPRPGSPGRARRSRLPAGPRS